MHDLELHQTDVKTAFLYGSLDEQVFMEQPEGFEQGKDMVWQLIRSPYGLKQAPRAWYKELDALLKILGFRRTISDHSIYVRDDSEGLIIVGVYVDDLTIAAAKLDTLVRFKNEMSKRYEMKDLGELHFILGLQVERDRKARSLHLNQQLYINTILERFGMSDCKPVKSPLRSKSIMSLRKEGEAKADRAQYLAAVGSLMYAMLGTRPDLAYPVGLLGRFASDPSETHWQGVLSVFKYLKHTNTLGITYSGGSDQLDGFSDADFATSDPDRRRVTSGYVFRLWGGAISWQSKKQPSVSLATGDAEYVALAQAARELMWLRSIMSELGFAPGKPITLYGDNQASISIAKNPVGHTRAKQIDIRFHYLRELVERGAISIEYIATTAMLADGLTKPLAPVAFARFIAMLGLSKTPDRSMAAMVSLAMISCDIIAESEIAPHDIIDYCSAMTSDDIVGEHSMTSSHSIQRDIRRPHLLESSSSYSSSPRTSCSISLNKDNCKEQVLEPRLDFTGDTSSDESVSVDRGSGSIDNAHSVSAALDALNRAILSAEKHLKELKAARNALIASTFNHSHDKNTSSNSSESDGSEISSVFNLGGPFALPHT